MTKKLQDALKTIAKPLSGLKRGDCCRVRALIGFAVRGPRGRFWTSGEEFKQAAMANKRFAGLFSGEVGIDPATIALIIELVIEVIDLIAKMKEEKKNK